MSRSTSRSDQRKRESSSTLKPPEGGLFRVLYCNADSLLNKMNDMTAFCCVEKPDFIVINETWANDSYNNAFFSIPGYEIICRKDRKDTSNGIGGGLIIYAKYDIARVVVEFSNDKMEDFVQCSAFKIPVEGKSITLVLL